MLSRICALAMAGRSCRQIAATFGLPKSTVHRWLQELREDCPTRVAGSAEMIADAFAGYKSLYDEALEAWRLSQADKEEEQVVETKTARGPRRKRTVRRESRVGNLACLAAARRALDGIAKLVARIAPRPGKNEREKGRKGERERDARAGVPLPQSEPIQLGTLRQGESRNLRDAEHRAVEAKCPTGTAPLADAAETPQPPSHLNSGDEVPQGLREERVFAPRGFATEWPGSQKTRTGTSRKRDGMGQAVATRLDADRHSEERQPPVFAEYFDWHPRPLVKANTIIRGKTRRQKLEFGFNCPIPSAGRNGTRHRQEARPPNPTGAL